MDRNTCTAILFQHLKFGRSQAAMLLWGRPAPHAEQHTVRHCRAVCREQGPAGAPFLRRSKRKVSKKSLQGTVASGTQACCTYQTPWPHVQCSRSQGLIILPRLIWNPISDLLRRQSLSIYTPICPLQPLLRRPLNPDLTPKVFERG